MNVIPKMILLKSLPNRVMNLPRLTVIVLIIFILPYFGIGSGCCEKRFSILSNNEPLSQTLARISKTTGYRIEITKGWKNKIITADMKKVTLEESMKTIVRLLGRPNHVLIIDEPKKRIEIRIFDASVTGQKDVKNFDTITKNDLRDEQHSPRKENITEQGIRETESEMELEIERERQREREQAQRRDMEMRARMQQEQEQERQRQQERERENRD